MNTDQNPSKAKGLNCTKVRAQQVQHINRSSVVSTRLFYSLSEVYITDGLTRWGFEKQTKLNRTTCSYLVYAANIRQFVLLCCNHSEVKL
jgi:hypothetical protein